MHTTSTSSPGRSALTGAVATTDVTLQLLADIIEQCADELDVPAMRLLATVELIHGSTRASNPKTQRLSVVAESLADQLRGNLRDANACLQAVPGWGSLVPARLEDAVSALRLSVRRSSVLLGRSDILLATMDRMKV